MRSRDWDTAVPESEGCYSACGLIWLAGAKRYLGALSEVGFHAPSRREGDRVIESGVGGAFMGAYLADLGLSDDMVYYVAAKPPDDMQILTPSDARSLGLPVLPLPPGLTPPR